MCCQLPGSGSELRRRCCSARLYAAPRRAVLLRRRRCFTATRLLRGSAALLSCTSDPDIVHLKSPLFVLLIHQAHRHFTAQASLVPSSSVRLFTAETLQDSIFTQENCLTGWHQILVKFILLILTTLTWVQQDFKMLLLACREL